ncbi:protein TUNAR-like [Bombina bombina]|uniref:protein TUNAR-like n=1 Tax=Bombina bombina TaxID=8345 RepID=UPI00235B173B|nr:protein TUNAR-like [Bombina bombina]
MPDANVLLMQSRTAFGELLKIFLGKMVTSAITAAAAEVKRQEEKEEKEESILAMLGIIGTVLNLFVIIFVYIYTTL